MLITLAYGMIYLLCGAGTAILLSEASKFDDPPASWKGLVASIFAWPLILIFLGTAVALTVFVVGTVLCIDWVSRSRGANGGSS